MFASGHTAIFYDYTLRAPVCQSTRTRKMQVVTRKTANSLTSGRRRAIIKVQQQAFTLFSPAYQSDHDARHGRLFSFAGLPASREARMRRHMRRISQAEGSAWLPPPFNRSFKEQCPACRYAMVGFSLPTNQIKPHLLLSVNSFPYNH